MCDGVATFVGVRSWAIMPKPANFPQGRCYNLLAPREMSVGARASETMILGFTVIVPEGFVGFFEPNTSYNDVLNLKLTAPNLRPGGFATRNPFRVFMCNRSDTSFRIEKNEFLGIIYFIQDDYIGQYIPHTRWLRSGR